MTKEQIILVEMLLSNAISEKEGLTLKEINDLVGFTASARLTDAKAKGYIASSKNSNISKYWLTKLGIKQAESSNSQANNHSENNDIADVNDTDVVESQSIDLNMDDSMLNDVVIPEPPEYDPTVVAFNQHSDAFINATNEGKKSKETVEFIVIDQHGDIAADGFECVSDAKSKAHELATIGGEYHVERIATRRMGSAKPVTTTQWVDA